MKEEGYSVFWEYLAIWRHFEWSQLEREDATSISSVDAKADAKHFTMTGQPPTTINHLAPDLRSAKVRKHCPKCLLSKWELTLDLETLKSSGEMLTFFLLP